MIEYHWIRMLIGVVLAMIIYIYLLRVLINYCSKDTLPEDIQCPVCGYYCLGKGGRDCIDKPTLCNLDK